MAEKKKILYIVEAMGGGVFTYIVDLANELVNKYDMYIAYAVRKQTPKNYKDYGKLIKQPLSNKVFNIRYPGCTYRPSFQAFQCCEDSGHHAPIR